MAGFLSFCTFISGGFRILTSKKSRKKSREVLRNDEVRRGGWFPVGVVFYYRNQQNGGIVGNKRV